MARNFSTTDRLDTPINNLDAFTVGLSMGVWVRKEVASGDARPIFRSDSPSASLIDMTRLYSNGRIECRAGVGTSDATSATSIAAAGSLVEGVWTCIVWSYAHSGDKKLRIYVGILTTPMAEVTYAAQIAATGTSDFTSTKVTIANAAPGLGPDASLEGDLHRLFLTQRPVTLEDAERFRLGYRPAQDGSLVAYWPFDSPTASRHEDSSGNGNHGSAATVVIVDNPPVPYLGYF